MVTFFRKLWLSLISFAFANTIHSYLIFWYTVLKKLTLYNLLSLFCAPWPIFDIKMTKFVNFFDRFFYPFAIKPLLYLAKTLVKFVILHKIWCSEKVTKFATFLKFNWKEVMSLKKVFPWLVWGLNRRYQGFWTLNLT